MGRGGKIPQSSPPKLLAHHSGTPLSMTLLIWTTWDGAGGGPKASLAPSDKSLEGAVLQPLD